MRSYAVPEKTVYELIIEAIEEAKILECAREEYEEDHMLYIAQRLSGAPYSFIEDVYHAA
jgi:hypothetical protein